LSLNWVDIEVCQHMRGVEPLGQAKAACNDTIEELDQLFGGMEITRRRDDLTAKCVVVNVLITARNIGSDYIRIRVLKWRILKV
jgi:hypothetical protein